MDLLGMLKSGPQGLNRLMGNSSGVVKPEAGPYPNAAWSLELWDPATKKPMVGVQFKWDFRWPPSSFTYDQSVRADVGRDLLGQSTTVYLGSGLGQIALSGSHGVKTVEGRHILWEGIAQQDTLDWFFDHWQILLSKANKAGTAYPNMVLAIRRGTQSEWANTQFLVWPLKRPTVERDASKPLEWRYSMQFHVFASKVGDNTVMTLSAAGEADLLAMKARASEGFLASLIRTAGEVAKFAKSVISTVTALKNIVKDVRAGILGAIQQVRGAIHQLSSDIADIQKALDTHSFSLEAKQEMALICRDLRSMKGSAKRLVQIDESSRRTTVVAPASGAPLQTLAKSVYGDASRWKEIASENNLPFPYAPAGPVLLPLGAPLSLASASEAAVSGIKIGSDLDPFGRMGVLATGTENLVEALLRRLRTPLGYLPHRPDYGSNLYTYIGEPLDISTAMSARAEVERTLLDDDRVTRIVNLSVSGADSLDGLFVTANVDCVYGALEISGAISRSAS